MSECWELTARELIGAFAAGSCSAREIVQAHLDRIAETNPDVNAVTAVLDESALATADEADSRRARGQAPRALEAVPMTVKEAEDVAGSATTSGLASFAGRIAAVDSPTVERLRAAGAVIVGRTNMPDVGKRFHTDSSAHGATRNPWNLDLTPGGSSGGDGAAVAVGMAAAGLGGDIGGSLRVPAHWCGIATLKPTPSRLPWASSFEPRDRSLPWSMMGTLGPLARCVEDVGTVYAVLAGPDPRDPWSMLPARGVDPPLPTTFTTVVDETVDRDIAEGVERAAAALEDAGYTRVESAPPAAAYEELWARLIFAGMDLEAFRPFMSADAVRFLELCFDVFPPPETITDWNAAFIERDRFAREWSLFQVDTPFVLTAPMTGPPFRIGYDVEGVDEVADILVRSRYLQLAGILCLPAAIVPTGTANGLPTAVQIIAPRHRDESALVVAAAIEERLGTVTPIDVRPAAPAPASV